jgi:lipid-binding SYLF domain-containing protein
MPSNVLGQERPVPVSVIFATCELPNNEGLSPMINRKRFLSSGTALGLFLSIGAAYADNYSDTVTVFKNAGKSASFFEHSYAYAIFPTIGEGGFVVGGAHGDGRVYVHGHLRGDTAMSQVSVGFLAGGKAFSQVIFFQDKRALDEFESGHFQFGADASVVAITAGASASAGTTGASASASGGENDATTAGAYQKGMVVFTVAKGGAMFDVSVDGQKFSYNVRG